MTINEQDLLAETLGAFERRDLERAAALLVRLDAENAPLGDSWGAVSRLAATLGEIAVARSAIRRYVQLAPYDVDRRLAYGALLAQAGHVEGAIKATRAFLPNAAPDARLRLLLGACHAQLGETDQAIEELRHALSLEPSPEVAAAAWLALSDLKRFETGDPDTVAMLDLCESLPDPPSALLYAMGKALDDIGDIDAAFILYGRGARQVAAQRPFDAAASRAFVDELISGSSSESLAALPPSAVDSDRPIFIIGLPRSGTTLVEQILASHSGVIGGSELNLFRVATMALNGYAPSDIAAYADGASPDAWTGFGQGYLHLLDERFGPEGRVVDKTLNHSRFVGLIRHVLPKARFIWLRRDPGDNALSCYRSHFADGVPWSWSMADIGHHFAAEDRLHAHWTAQFPDAILTVPYEALVSDPDDWIARILDHCGLPFEPQVKDFHLTRRAVTTTSGSQVRQPLYSRAVGSSRRYEAQLRPFFEAYAAASG